MENIFTYKQWCSANKCEPCNEALLYYLAYLQTLKVIP